jgi:bacterioferritin (cytochrome b1)
MGTATNTKALVRDLNRALPLLARDALASSIAAGAVPGVDGIALGRQLTEIAAAELADVERMAARIASLGGSPSVQVGKLDLPKSAPATIKRLAALQRESNDAVVAAIPADADDAEGEATEHLLEHIVARKRDVIELLERATR